MSHFTEAGYWPAPKTYQDDQPSLSVRPIKPSPIEESVRHLRLRLKHLNAWPAAGDTFLELLQHVSDHDVSLASTDFDWLEQVANDACEGKDIGLHYPSIFQKLLTSLELRQKFMHLLQLRSAEL